MQLVRCMHRNTFPITFPHSHEQEAGIIPVLHKPLVDMQCVGIALIRLRIGVLLLDDDTWCT